jgi:putative ABC transport system permease protein
VIHYSVTQRTSEIGLRVALGAKSADVQRSVVSEAMKFALIGLSIGLAGALGLNRLFVSLLYGVKPWDALRDPRCRNP